MSEFEAFKADLSRAGERLQSARETSVGLGLLRGWRLSLLAFDAAKLACSFDPRKVDNWYHEDEIVFSKHVHFFNESSLRECCSPGDDCIAGARCMPVGLIDGGDEFLFVTDTPTLNVAILHHDDVYLAAELDATVLAKSERLDLPLGNFIDLLHPETNLAKLTVSNDASSWLVVEQIGCRVRYEFNLPNEQRDGEQAFESVREAESFFFDTIKSSSTKAALAILSCSPQIRERVMVILQS